VVAELPRLGLELGDEHLALDPGSIANAAGRALSATTSYESVHSSSSAIGKGSARSALVSRPTQTTAPSGLGEPAITSKVSSLSGPMVRAARSSPGSAATRLIG